MKKVLLILILIFDYCFSYSQITSTDYSVRLKDCYASYTYYDSDFYPGYYIGGDTSYWVLVSGHSRIACTSESTYKSLHPSRYTDLKRSTDDGCNSVDIRFNTKSQIVEVCNPSQGVFVPLENAISYNENTGELICRDTYTENSISNLSITTNPSTGSSQSYYYNTYSCVFDGPRDPKTPTDSGSGSTDSNSTTPTDSGSGSTDSNSTTPTDSGSGSTDSNSTTPTDSGSGSTDSNSTTPTDSGSGSTGSNSTTPTDSGSGSTGSNSTTPTDSGSGSTDSNSTTPTDSGSGSTDSNSTTPMEDETLIGLLHDLNNNSNANTNKITDSISSQSNILNTTLKDSLQDSEGKPFLQTISEFTKIFTTPITNEEKNTFSENINNNVKDSLDNTFIKYSNILGFGSNYGSRPENITLRLFNQEYILINFTLLDPFVSIIRSLFLSLAYLYGFLNLIRSVK